MRRRAIHGVGFADDGNAIVEFVVLAVLLMIPLVYLLLTVFRVQTAAYAASSAAREAGRVFVTAPSLEVAEARAEAAARIVLADSGLSMRRADLRVICSDDPCLEPGARVTVVVSQVVGLPLVPDVFGGRHPAAIRTSSEHVEVVDRYRTAAR